MRVFVGAPTANIKVWQVSKIQDNQTPARGVKMVTLSLTERNNDTDYINVDTKEFYADYYVGVIPSDNPTPSPTPQPMTCAITATNNQIKVGGSYKTLTAKFYDFAGTEITEDFLSSLSLSSWKCYIDDVDVTDSGLVTLVKHSESNKIKVKFSSDRSYLGKILVVKCVTEHDRDMIVGEIKLDIVSV